MEHLQGAAEAGCGLCDLIRNQLHLLLSEIEGLDKETRRTYEPSYRPTVDLWLARRPYGGQGFWVLSESIGSRDEREIIPIAAFSFAVAEDNPLADSIYARPVQQSPEAYALQQLREWDTQCKRHRECYPVSRAVPRYLVDVGCSKSEESVKLVQLGAGGAEYIALSYASDGSTEVQWRSHNADAEEKTILTTDLPKIFRDAILVTRTLGVQYIWIDSLCIPGNAPEWERDSEEIGSVYENAYLTVSATGAEKVADGLLFSRPSRTSVQILYRSSDGSVNGIVSVSTLPLSKEVLRNYIEMQKEPISKDIWAFQERVLSRRIVHFASDQMYFECLGHFRSEDGLLEGARFHSTVEKLHSGPDYYREQTALDRWHSLLRAYGKLDPTTPSEKLRALSNIARAFQRLLGDEYVAGLWKNSLIESLCWRSMKCKPLCGSTAPSWSWAGVNGIAFAGFGFRSVCPEATISSTQVTLENDAKPFGNVASASIVIAAPVVPLKLVENGGEGRHIFLRTEDGHEDGFYAGFDVIGRQDEVSAEGIRNSKLFALVLVLLCWARVTSHTTATYSYIHIPEIADYKYIHITMPPTKLSTVSPAFMLLGGVSSLPSGTLVRGLLNKPKATPQRFRDVEAEWDFFQLRTYGVGIPQRASKMKRREASDRA
ncbi:Heterokaryon incompatibility [Cordyceps javanica]|uniref:Heterokaryon incompatibility n=1 Tax=Cordyceps javanica TaxID=43265 RepID=A0A545VEC1_9HYPO|nr:Heterokaryon incompatibility [Cordyceps javanica]